MDESIKPITYKKQPKMKKLVYDKEKASSFNLDFGLLKREKISTDEIIDNTIKSRKEALGIRIRRSPKDGNSRIDEGVLPLYYREGIFI